MRISDWSSDVCSSDLEVAARVLERLQAADVDVPEVERRRAAVHPLGQRLAGASGRLDADGVDAGVDVEVREFRRLAEAGADDGGEALRPVEEGEAAGAFPYRHTLHHVPLDRGSVVVGQRLS